MIFVGPKDLGTLSHLISSPRPTSRRKKCPRANEGNLDHQIVLPRMTFSSAGQNHGEKATTSPEDIHSRITKEIPSHMG